MTDAAAASSRGVSRKNGRKPPVYEFDASKSRFAFAWNDLKQAFSRPKLILTLVKKAFLARYQGTLLGGFWITITTLMTVIGMGVLYGQIFNSPRAEYLPYIAVGIVFWGVISAIINDAASVFLAASGVFTQTPIAKSLFVIRAIGVACLTLFFKLFVVVGMIYWWGISPGPLDWLVATGGLIVILWTGFWLSLGLGALGARFRDIGQLTAAFVTLAFFITPVFWQTERLGDYQFVAKLNPLFHYLNTVRGPLLGLDGVGESFVWALSFAGLTTIFGAVVYGLFARRLCYWS